ncbi:hypothetical protein HMPREF3293_01688 [Christensenella minuta]|uniref:Uncharacterized protein n=1 Tax=Christensenella minuta TaxID=626937 RepID=A0A136Q4F0_9FIRM|nr:hypothetical protein HMPREF3293_01688 [Christensenella minuta]
MVLKGSRFNPCGPPGFLLAFLNKAAYPCRRTLHIKRPCPPLL